MTPQPRSMYRLVATGLLSVVSVLATSLLLRTSQLGHAPRVALAVLPLPFFFAFIWEELRWIRSQDEFHRGVLLESLAMAFPLSIALAVVVESLQKAGLFTRLGVGDVWPWMALTWLPALWIATRRYR